jgi:hypothetical protein
MQLLLLFPAPLSPLPIHQLDHPFDHHLTPRSPICARPSIFSRTLRCLSQPGNPDSAYSRVFSPHQAAVLYMSSFTLVLTASCTTCPNVWPYVAKELDELFCSWYIEREDAVIIVMALCSNNLPRSLLLNRISFHKLVLYSFFSPLICRAITGRQRDDH